MKTHAGLPIRYQEDELFDEDKYIEQFYDAEFYEDFGIFKKGEVIKVLSVNYDTFTVQEWLDNGKIDRQQVFTFKPVIQSTKTEQL